MKKVNEKFYIKLTGLLKRYTILDLKLLLLILKGLTLYISWTIKNYKRKSYALMVFKSATFCNEVLDLYPIPFDKFHSILINKPNIVICFTCNRPDYIAMHCSNYNGINLYLVENNNFITFYPNSNT